MKRKDIQNLSQASKADLEKKEEDLRVQIQKMMFGIAEGSEKNVQALQGLKRDRARVLTFLKMQREVVPQENNK